MKKRAFHFRVEESEKRFKTLRRAADPLERVQALPWGFNTFYRVPAGSGNENVLRGAL